METRSCCGGWTRRSEPFNGATAFRRWKPASPCWRTLMTSPLQWGHRLSAMETSITLLEDPDDEPPSMGPPPFGDGNLGTTFRSGTPSVFLQWGHRLSAMETRRRPRSTPSLTSLQWGHRLSAMETLPVGAGLPTAVAPSMGPPPFGDGNGISRSHGSGIGGPSMGPPPFGDGNSPAGCPC